MISSKSRDRLFGAQVLPEFQPAYRKKQPYKSHEPIEAVSGSTAVAHKANDGIEV
jgi:hypothetical protein